MAPNSSWNAHKKKSKKKNHDLVNNYDNFSRNNIANKMTIHFH